MSLIYVKGSNIVPAYDTDTLDSIDLTGKSEYNDNFYAELSANASLVLHDATHTGLKDGVTRYLTIKNTHATDSISITLPANFGGLSPLMIASGDYGVIEFTYHTKIGKWFLITYLADDYA